MYIFILYSYIHTASSDRICINQQRYYTECYYLIVYVCIGSEKHHHLLYRTHIKGKLYTKIYSERHTHTSIVGGKRQMTDNTIVWLLYDYVYLMSETYTYLEHMRNALFYSLYNTFNHVLCIHPR